MTSGKQPRFTNMLDWQPSVGSLLRSLPPLLWLLKQPPDCSSLPCTVCLQGKGVQVCTDRDPSLLGSCYSGLCLLAILLSWNAFPALSPFALWRWLYLGSVVPTSSYYLHLTLSFFHRDYHSHHYLHSFFF